jgi:hypothetical protein
MAMRVGIAEFLENVSKLKKRAEKIEVLKANDSFHIRTILQGAFDPRIRWQLPAGVPPYNPTTLVDQENVLIHSCRKLIYFVEGGSPGLKQLKRESMFIELLETVSPSDAKLLCAIKDKKLPYKGITADIVREAFPDLLPPEESKA